MNRIIKFRFWTPDKIMLDDHEGWIEGIGINGALSTSREYGYVAMQFTGLLDKNEKEMYDGDICIKRYDKSLFPNREPIIGVIKWVDFGGRYTLESSFKGFKNYCEIYENLTNPNDERSPFEVIGNIYQNPELLP
jgi:uncharacterized phage protein (TIGR01671 family)